MDIGAIKARIAELEQRKAERNAMRGYRDLSYLDYMTQGDRSGFDKIEADEVAYRNMLAQQKFQEQQRALDRELSRELAKTANSSNSNVANEIANKYELANTDYELALQTFNPDDPASVANLKRKGQILNHYGSQLGFEPVSLDAPTSRPKTGVEEQKDYEGEAQALLGKKSYTNADKDRIKALIPLVKDVTTKAQLEAKLVDKGKTKEDKDEARLKQLQALIDSGKNLSTKQRSEYNRLKSGK